MAVDKVVDKDINYLFAMWFIQIARIGGTDKHHNIKNIQIFIQIH
jgi:hypothetical protein